MFKAGYASPVRTPRGRDILAACGQLKSETEKLRARARLMLEHSLVLGGDDRSIACRRGGLPLSRAILRSLLAGACR